MVVIQTEVVLAFFYYYHVNMSSHDTNISLTSKLGQSKRHYDYDTHDLTNTKPQLTDYDQLPLTYSRLTLAKLTSVTNPFTKHIDQRSEIVPEDLSPPLNCRDNNADAHYPKFGPHLPD